MVKIKPHLLNSLYLFDYIGKELNTNYLWAPWPILDMVPYGYIRKGQITKFTDNVKQIRDHFKDYLDGDSESNFSKNYIEVTMSEFSKFRHIFHCMLKGIKIECDTKSESKFSSKGPHIKSAKSEKEGSKVEFRGCCEKNDGCCCPPIRIKDSKTEGTGPNRKVIVTCEKVYDNYPCSRNHNFKIEGSLNLNTTELYSKYDKDLKGRINAYNSFKRTFLYDPDDESKIEDKLLVSESVIASSVAYFVYEKNWVFKEVQQSSNSIRVRKWSNIPDPIFVLLTQQQRRELNINVEELEPISHICPLEVTIRDVSEKTDEENNKPKNQKVNGRSQNLTKLTLSVNDDNFEPTYQPTALEMDFKIYRIVYIESSKKFLIFFDFTIVPPQTGSLAYFLATPKDKEEEQIPMPYELDEGDDFLTDYKYTVKDSRFRYKDDVSLELKKLKITFSDGGSEKVSKELEYYRYSRNKGLLKPEEDDSETCLSKTNDSFSKEINIKNIEYIGWSKSDFDEKYIYPDF